LVAAAAAEEGLALVTRQSQRLADPLQLELEQAAVQQQQEHATVTLGELAAAVRQQHPGLFLASGGTGAAAGGGAVASPQEACTGGQLRLRQVAALQDVLYRQYRLKHEPFEWVYEGLAPLLLPPTLPRRKLAPLTLATVAAGVARRLGLPLLPAPAEGGEGIAAAVAEGVAGGPAAQGQLPLGSLRPDVAQRYAGRAQGMAPAAAPWALLLPAEPSSSSSSSSSRGAGIASSASGGGSQQAWTHVVDACTGEVVDAAAAAAAQRFPHLRLVGAVTWRKWPAPWLTLLACSPPWLPWPCPARAKSLAVDRFPPAQGADWCQRAPLAAWQHMVRTLIQVGCLLWEGGGWWGGPGNPMSPTRFSRGGPPARPPVARFRRWPATPGRASPAHTCHAAAAARACTARFGTCTICPLRSSPPPPPTLGCALCSAQAHQRRGESDLVAHWVYVLLALDPQAPEWGHVLQPGRTAQQLAG
jgi:hypothetical protein